MLATKLPIVPVQEEKSRCEYTEDKNNVKAATTVSLLRFGQLFVAFLHEACGFHCLCMQIVRLSPDTFCNKLE